MPVTNKEQRARPVHRQVNSDALDNFIEVHVAAKAARITRGHRAAPRRGGDAPEHRTKWHSEALKVIARALAGRNHALSIEMPANIISGVLEFHGHAAVNGAVNDGVIADGVVAIQANAREVYGERVTGPGGFNVERSGLRIAAQRSPDAAFVRAAGINRGCVNRVAGRDVQHWRRRSGELPVEGCRREFVALRRTTARRRHARGSNSVLLYILRIVG